MNPIKKMTLLLFCLLFISNAQAWENDSTWDRETMTIPGSPTLPSNCHDKQVFQDTDATSGQQFYLCEDGTWVKQGDGGAGASGTVASGVGGRFAYYPSTGTTVDDQTNLFTSGTNIGIGTSVPTAKLEVIGPGGLVGAVAQFYNPSSSTILTNDYGAFQMVNPTATTNNFIGFLFADSSTGNASTGIQTVFTERTLHYGDVVIGTRAADGYNERFRVISNGNIGISTSVPQARLTVQGTGTTTAKAVSIQDSSAAEKVTILDNGNVGIGISAPAQKLTVGAFANWNSSPYADFGVKQTTARAMMFQRSADDSVLVITGDSAKFSFTTEFNSSGAYLPIWITPGDNNHLILQATGSGNVGIGTSVPTRKLEVVGGAAKADDYYSGDGTQGLTQTCSSAVIGLTIKDGLITAVTCP